MKAYKYHRYQYGPSISAQSLSLSEYIIYIPEIKRLIYKGYDGMKQEDYFGVCEKGTEIETKITKEAEEYVNDIKKGLILPLIEEAEEKTVSNPAQTTYQNMSMLPKRATDLKFYVKKIPNHDVTNSIFGKEFILSDYEEIDLEITLEDIQNIENNAELLKKIKHSQDEYKNKFFKI